MRERFYPTIIRERTVKAGEYFAQSSSDADRLEAATNRELRCQLEDEAFKQGFDCAWRYCQEVWQQEPFVWAWIWLIRTPRRPAMPYAATLHERLTWDFPDSPSKIALRVFDSNSISAGNAILCLAEHPDMIPLRVFERAEELTLRDWFVEQVMTIGDWARLVHERGCDSLE